MNWTLHVAIVALLLSVPVCAQAPAPTVDQILDKYVEAIGGKAGFDKLTSRVMIGSFENPRVTVPLEIYAKPPDLRVEIMGLGEASQGFNGKVGWSMNVTENGLRELTGPALARFRRQSLFNREANIREQYDRLTLAGKARIGDRETYVLEGAGAARRNSSLTSRPGCSSGRASAPTKSTSRTTGRSTA